MGLLRWLGLDFDRPANTLARSVWRAERNFSQTFLECCQNVVNMGLEASDLLGKQVSRAMILSMADFNANNSNIAENLNNTINDAADRFNENNLRMVTEVLRSCELRADRIIAELSDRGAEYAEIARKFQVFLERSSQKWWQMVASSFLAVIFVLLSISIATFMPETDKRELSFFLKWSLADKTYSMIDMILFIARGVLVILFVKALMWMADRWKMMSHDQELTAFKVRLMEKNLALERENTRELNERVAVMREEINTRLTADFQEMREHVRLEDQRISDAAAERVANLETKVKTGMENLSKGISMSYCYGEMTWNMATVAMSGYDYNRAKASGNFQQNERTYETCVAQYKPSLHDTLFPSPRS